MTSQWPDNCDAVTWKVISNSLDIDLIYGDIRGRSHKNDESYIIELWISINNNIHELWISINNNIHDDLIYDDPWIGYKNPNLNDKSSWLNRRFLSIIHGNRTFISNNRLPKI